MDKIKVNSDKKNTSIEELEYAIVSKNYVDAEESLTLLIRQSVENKIELVVAPFDRTLTKEQKELESYQVIEKLAVLITMWFSDKSYKPSDNTYAFICLQKMFISNVFAASSYHSTDHILANLGLMGKSEYTSIELQMLLFVITNESSLEIPWDVMFKHLPEHSILAYSGLIRSINVQLSERAHNSIARLIEAASYAPVVKSSNVANLSPLISTLFNCSNLNGKNKYFIKQWVVKSLNKYMEDNLDKKLKYKIKNEVRTVPNKDKAKMVLIHEHYTENHAMYRCWHSSFKAFLHDFNVTAIGLSSCVDDVGRKDAHHFTGIEDKYDVVGFIEAILKEKPDIVVFASIGMSMFAPFIATQRLAPIQIVCGGHPSSSYMDTIDYMLWEDFVPKSVMKKILTEKFLPYKSNFTPARMVPYSLNISPKDDTVKIIINGVVQKITTELVGICNRLMEKTDKKLEFHLFMSHPKQDLDYFSTMSILRRFMPSCIVHPFTNYNDYMNVVGNCNFALPTIPFGGSNSNIDLIRLRVPKLFIQDESDLCGLTDYQIWKSVDVLDGYCSDVIELEKRALEWILDPNLLIPIKEKLECTEVTNLMLDCEKSVESDFRIANAIKSTLN
ncbi:hypothetical protein GCM10008107_08910 [Psychrosphaera saromensis]|uniref:HMW1C N-terminal domain-containing protein n=1 Tax=Psychrosphaera saromensis TaxID=716813 RepID=A0A2S7UVR5_9GAMM|nr:hypothetical protein [Psychrosphaera saromensis]PQJ53815.1 hypothetical protein BTO11_09155 [Psychrosphaera saromensis]GHB62132.1 hypothetical protein GCM10008107_08910 [Psychrosphaera saromensis]GLQ15394.1 hypothetical protein GCM10007917_28490 [Psychrosphaera saromensis]